MEERIDISRWDKRKDFEEILDKLIHHTKALLDTLMLAKQSCQSKVIAKITYEETKARGANIFRLREKLGKLIGEEKGD